MFDVHLFVSFCFSFQNIDICHLIFHLGLILKCKKSFLLCGHDLKIFVWLSTLPSPHPSCWAFLFGQPLNVFQTGAEQSLYFYFLFGRICICGPFVFWRRGRERPIFVFVWGPLATGILSQGSILILRGEHFFRNRPQICSKTSTNTEKLKFCYLCFSA